MAAGATLAIEIGGDVAGAGYDRVAVNGTVNLGGATLAVDLPGGFVPSVGNRFTIIDNDGDDAVTGVFAGLAEGATFSVDGWRFAIRRPQLPHRRQRRRRRHFRRLRRPRGRGHGARRRRCGAEDQLRRRRRQ